MRSQFTALALAALTFASPAFAADGPVGRWAGMIQGHPGMQPMVLEVKGDGSGTMETAQAPKKQLEDGKTEGTTFTFFTSRPIMGKMVRIEWKCAISGDTMTVVHVVPIGPTPGPAPAFTLQRLQP